MGNQCNHLKQKHCHFIQEQPLFFVATATNTSRINLSPKGGNTLKIINDSQVIWLNLTGSGNETSAHIQLDSRMTIMFCAFEGKLLILRLYGKAQVFHHSTPEWQKYYPLFDDCVEARQLFLLNIDLVQGSCGMAVPLMSFEQPRNNLKEWSQQQGKKGIQNYWKKHNKTSIDDLNTNIAKLNNLN